MIYVETNSTDVYFNFGVEHYFTTEKQLPEPVFLFWRTTPTLMLGHYQNPYEEIDLEYARTHDIALVRRMSGGGTIYTDLGSWQFSFIVPGDEGDIDFQSYLRPVLRALKALGLNAEFNGRNDLLIDGRKFCGNAQYRKAGYTVHHGSLLFDCDIGQMVASTHVDPYKILSKSIRSVRERVTNLAEHLSQPMTPEVFKRQVVAAIVGAGDAYVMTSQDEARAHELGDRLFRDWNQVFGATPRFSIQRDGRFPGGHIAVSLDVSQGHIAAIAFSGDFFATDVDALQVALVGIAYRRENVREVLSAPALANIIYGISPEALAELIVP